jgi:transposase
MPILTLEIKRRRMIDWYNWRREIPRSRATIQQFKKKIQELEDVVEGLEDVVAEKDRLIAEREKRIKELEEEVGKLKGTQKKLREMVFKPEETQEEENKRGAKDGHRAFFRRKPKPEDITEKKKVRLQHCPECQGKLGAPYGWRSRISIDIPPPQTPSIIEWRMARYHCKGCKKWVQGQPEGLFGKSPFGINLIMKVLDMKYRGKDTDAYIQENLKRWHGIDLSDGGIHAILDHAARLFGPSYAAIKQALRDGKLVQADETGWRVEGENWYAWAFLNPEVILYQIENTRGNGVPKEALQGFHGVLIHDAYQGYNAVEGAEHGICGVHFLRHTHDDLAEAEGASDKAKEFHYQMTWFFRVARKKKKRCKNDGERLALHAHMQRALERYWKNVTYDDPLVEATRKWWLENRGDQLLTFLKYADVPWDNNAAERAVRPMVRRRKITGGSRSERGAEREAINMSCITTLLKQGKDLFREVPILWKISMESANS